MENLSIRFVDKLYQMAHADIPERVIQKARVCLIDYLAVTAGGSRAYDEIHRGFIRENGFDGGCHIIGSELTADLRTAVMINAFNAHVLELDDSHRVAMTHLGAPIFSALIGAAEWYKCSLDEVIRAAVIGYEAAIRLANTIQPSHKKRGFHVSGTCCTVGCAMGIACMLGYTKQEMGNVLSAAATSAAGLLGVISGVSEQKPYNVANAASAGLNAALYGKYFNGAVDILNGPRGFFTALSDEFHTERLFEDGYAIESIYQKLYAACRHCHAPVEAMLLLKQEHPFAADSVEKIDVDTYDLAIFGHDHTEITGVSSAKQSIPYSVAAACLHDTCGMEMFTEQMASDEDNLRLTQRVSVREDAELTALVPGKRAAIVTVSLNDGTQLSRRVDYPKGEPENPITWEEQEEKFYALTGFAGIPAENGQKIAAFIRTAGAEKLSQIFQWL